MEEYQRRVVVEYSDLVDKKMKLEAFIAGPASNGISSNARFMLREQLETMDAYKEILKKRIASFGISLSESLIDMATTHCPARAVQLIRDLHPKNDDATYRQAVQEIVANVR